MYSATGDIPSLQNSVTQSPRGTSLLFHFTVAQENQVVWLDAYFPQPLYANDTYDVQSVGYNGHHQTLRWVYVGKQGCDVRYGGEPFLRGVTVEAWQSGYRIRLPLFTVSSRQRVQSRLTVFKHNANPVVVVPLRFCCA